MCIVFFDLVFLPVRFVSVRSSRTSSSTPLSPYSEWLLLLCSIVLDLFWLLYLAFCCCFHSLVRSFVHSFLFILYPLNKFHSSCPEAIWRLVVVVSVRIVVVALWDVIVLVAVAAAAVGESRVGDNLDVGFLIRRITTTSNARKSILYPKQPISQSSSQAGRHATNDDCNERRYRLHRIHCPLLQPKTAGVWWSMLHQTMKTITNMFSFSRHFVFPFERQIICSMYEIIHDWYRTCSKLSVRRGIVRRTFHVVG